MEFTFEAYKRLIKLIKNEGYNITNYHDYQNYNITDGGVVILRHDIDNSVDNAYKMAVVENQLGVESTYFVMLTSEFYNVAASCNVKKLRQMKSMGHNIGLHFDESIYSDMDCAGMIETAQKEKKILEGILEIPINEISMHRPSKVALKSNWKFEGMINSYSTEFFENFKYISDSRMYWREDVEKIVKSHMFNKLHILVHAFWYGNTVQTIEEKVKSYICSAKVERWDIMNRNFRDLNHIVDRKDIENDY